MLTRIQKVLILLCMILLVSVAVVLNAFAIDPIGVWHFDEDNGPFTYDATNNNNDGYLYDASWETYGFSHSAVHFDANNDYIEMDISSKPVQFTAKVTVEGWFKTEKSSGTIFSYVHTGGGTPKALDDSLKIYISNGQLNARVWTNNPGSQWESALTAAGIIKTGTWYHFAYVFDGNQKINKLYLNGVLKDSKSTVGSTVHYSNYIRLYVIGARGENGWYEYANSLADYFGGLIDELKIYNYALGDKEIRKEYESLSTSLISHWSFNENYGYYAYDYGNKNNTGNIKGASWTPTAKFGKALSFNGWNDYVNCGTGISTAQYDLPITLEAWIYKIPGGGYNNQGYDGIITTDNSDRYAGVSMQLGLLNNDSGKYPICINFGDGTGAWSATRRSKMSSPIVEPYKFYHIVGVIKGANDMSIYIDGVDVGGTYSGTGGNMVWLRGPCVIGTTWSAVNYCFKGIIDEVKIYNRALSEDEILEDFNSDQTHAYGYAIGSSVEPWYLQKQYFSPAFATDHNRLYPSRWSSDWTVTNPTPDDEYIYLDFGTAKKFNTVKLDWETAYGKKYKIQVADYLENWTTIYEETDGNGGIDEIFVGPKTARYVRMQGIQRATQYGYSLWEFTVYK